MVFPLSTIKYDLFGPDVLALALQQCRFPLLANELVFWLFVHQVPVHVVNAALCVGGTHSLLGTAKSVAKAEFSLFLHIFSKLQIPDHQWGAQVRSK